MKLAELTNLTFAKLYDTWLKYALLVFPAQHISNGEQVVFAKRFGELEFDLTALINVRDDGSIRISNDADMVKILKGNMSWHTDSTYMPVQAKGAFLLHTWCRQKAERPAGLICVLVIAI